MLKTRAKDAAATMTAMRKFASRFARNDSGATAIEYGLIVGLMALACITAFTKVGGASGGAWGNTANTASAAMK